MEINYERLSKMQFIKETAANFNIPYEHFMSYMFFGIITSEDDIPKFILYYENRRTELEKNISEMQEIQHFIETNDLPSNNQLNSGWGNVKNIPAKTQRLKNLDYIIDDLSNKKEKIDKLKKITNTEIN
jgi:hypothetical protein